VSADAIVSYALTLEGLSFGDTREKYIAVIYPFDNSAQARQMGATQESCGLTCEAILRASEVDGTCKLLGITRDHLRVPYASRLGTTVSMQEQLGHERGLWVSATQAGRPDIEAGDMVTIGGGAAFGGTTHALTVTGVGTDGLLETIEGGQPDPGNGGHCTAIRRKRREVYVRNGGLWLRSAGVPEAGRQVRGWLRAGELPVLGAT
jgi:hypothetical protein